MHGVAGQMRLPDSRRPVQVDGFGAPSPIDETASKANRFSGSTRNGIVGMWSVLCRGMEVKMHQYVPTCRDRKHHLRYQNLRSRSRRQGVFARARLQPSRRCLGLAGRRYLRAPQSVDRGGDSFSGLVDLLRRRFDAHAEPHRRMPDLARPVHRQQRRCRLGRAAGARAAQRTGHVPRQVERHQQAPRRRRRERPRSACWANAARASR